MMIRSWKWAVSTRGIFFVCQQQVLSVFIGNAAVLWYGRFQSHRTHWYLDQCARAIYILRIVLYVHAYLMYIPVDLISR